MRTHLRRNQSTVLSADQADENIEFLSSVITLDIDSQLQSGGVYYQPAGNLRHTMPGPRSSRFALTISTGTATLVGEVDGRTDPLYGPGPERQFRQVGGKWREVSIPAAVVSGGTSQYASRDTGGLIDAPLTWMSNANPATLTLPATAPDGTAIGVIRGASAVLVVVEGGDEISGVDHATGQPKRDREARIGRTHKLARFLYVDSAWYATE